MNLVRNADVDFLAPVLSFFGSTITLHEVRLVSLGSKNKVMGAPAQAAGTLLGTFSTASAVPVLFTVTEIVANCADPFSGNFPDAVVWAGATPGAANDDILVEYRVTDDKGNVSQWFKYNALIISSVD